MTHRHFKPIPCCFLVFIIQLPFYYKDESHDTDIEFATVIITVNSFVCDQARCNLKFPYLYYTNEACQNDLQKLISPLPVIVIIIIIIACPSLSFLETVSYLQTFYVAKGNWSMIKHLIHKRSRFWIHHGFFCSWG